jgi:TldD protein
MSQWTRRAWLEQNAAVLLAAMPASRLVRVEHGGSDALRRTDAARGFHTSPTSERAALAQHAVEAALQAGAQYADTRLTRTEYHRYAFGRGVESGVWARETVGIGVRALVNGYWGFAAAPSADRAAAAQLARAAVAQAAVNARGALPRTVDLGQLAPVHGTWTTPVTIDPFAVPIEEKRAFMTYWEQCATAQGLAIDTIRSHLSFARQERVVATSEGAQFVQTVYESGGEILVMPIDNPKLSQLKQAGSMRLPIQGIATAGRGWELFLEARIRDQLQAMPDLFVAADALYARAKPALVGRYTLVCDGATMAALVSATFGVATQVDRALGYEANAGGTSFLDDPLAMVGTLSVASPLVTVTGNRSAPTQLATVKWDDEGVEPHVFTLIKDGVLTDYQTTREQAAWLAPYYMKVGRPVRSNGCAASEDALAIPLQHVPNLTLEPSPSGGRLDDLVTHVKSGLLLEGGQVFQMDSQARHGLLGGGTLREITDGRLGPLIQGGAVLFDTTDFWKHVTAVGGAGTTAVLPFSQYPYGGESGQAFHLPVKGQPAQASSYSVQAAAATITNQSLIIPSRKA